MGVGGGCCGRCRGAGGWAFSERCPRAGSLACGEPSMRQPIDDRVRGTPGTWIMAGK